MRTVPADAKILLVGHDPAAQECLKQLVAAGAKHFTILDDKPLDENDRARKQWLVDAAVGQPAAEAIAEWLSKYAGDVTVEARVEAPLAVTSQSPEYVSTFSLVVTLGVPREIEVAFGKILWEAPSRVLIISKSNGFQAKMRSQYRTHKNLEDPHSAAVEGIDLVPHPESPTAEKMERVRIALTEDMDVTSPELLSALLLMYASGAVFTTVHGYPPAHRPGDFFIGGHEDEVEALIRKSITEKELGDVPVNTDDIRTCCEHGWGALPLTATVMGALIAGEGVRLLSSRGRVVNCAILDLGARAVLGIPAVV